MTKKVCVSWALSLRQTRGDMSCAENVHIESARLYP